MEPCGTPALNGNHSDAGPLRALSGIYYLRNFQ